MAAVQVSINGSATDVDSHPHRHHRAPRDLKTITQKLALFIRSFSIDEPPREVHPVQLSALTQVINTLVVSPVKSLQHWLYSCSCGTAWTYCAMHFRACESDRDQNSILDLHYRSSDAPTRDISKEIDSQIGSTTMGAMSCLQRNEMNIVQLALSGKMDPSLPILIDAEQPTRFVSKEKAIQLTASLTGAFEEGTTVCLNIPNDVTYPILMMAIWASNCRWTGVNPGYKALDLKHHFCTSETRYVVTCEEQLEKVQEAVAGSGQDIQIIIFSDILDTQLSPEQTACGVHRGHRHGSISTEHVYLHQLQRPRSAADLFKAMGKIDSHSIAALASTSGTTGMPKMAARTHKSHVLEALAIADNHASKPYQVRRLFCTPIFHSFSTCEMVINCLRFGRPAYYLKRYDEELFSKAVHDYKITETFAPPPLILKLVDNTKAHSQIQSLRNIYCGGAPLVPELRGRLNAIYNCNAHGPPRITQVYGMTEGGWFTTFKYDDPDTTNSVGRPVPGCEIRVVERDGFKSFEGIKTGELLVRSPMLMSRYLGNPQATADSYEGDGWLKTGDVGYISADGKVYLVDRCKDLIKVNGWQVSPTELENALMTIPDVLDTGVVGAGTGTSEHPVAFVVRANEAVTEGVLKAQLRQQLASYKVSMMEIRFVDALPKSITGKILKVELRKLCV